MPLERSHYQAARAPGAENTTRAERVKLLKCIANHDSDRVAEA